MHIYAIHNFCLSLNICFLILLIFTLTGLGVGGLTAGTGFGRSGVFLLATPLTVAPFLTISAQLFIFGVACFPWIALMATALAITGGGVIASVVIFILLALFWIGELLFLLRFFPPLGVLAATTDFTITGVMDFLVFDLADAGLVITGVFMRVSMPVKLISSELLLLTFFGVLRSFLTPENEASPMPLPTDFLPLVADFGDLLELDDFLGVASFLGVFGDEDLALGVTLVSFAAVLAGDTLGEADLDLDVLFASDFGVADFGVDSGVKVLSEDTGLVFGDCDLALPADFGVFGDLDLALGVDLGVDLDGDLDFLDVFGVDSVDGPASRMSGCCLGLDFLLEPAFGEIDLALGADFVSLFLLAGDSDFDLGAFFWEDFGDFLF